MVFVSIFVALVCIAASTRRLWLAANATVLAPDDVVAALAKGAKLSDIEALVRDVPEAEWERELLAALSSSREDVRVALINEQLTELDLRLSRWVRVPRVCASVATSIGIMLGTLVLRNGLATSDFIGEDFVMRIIGEAISVVAFGIIATTFCIAAHAHARRMTRARLEATDAMIERLEAAAAGAGSYR